METTRPIELETACKRCGRRWIPTSRDVRVGAWQTCPTCRAGEIEEAA